MVLKGNRYKRIVYCFEFPDNHFYVGLTFDKVKRFNSHITEATSSVFKHIKKTGLNPTFKELTDYIPKEEAVEKENFFLDEYISKGWVPLNVAKTGSLGSNLRIWTKEKIIEIVKKYSTISDFRKYDQKAYYVSHNQGWYDEITKNLKSNYKFYKYDEEIVKNLIKNYKNLADFRKGEPGAYNFILTNKLKYLLIDLERGDIIKYNLENVKIEAKKYKTKKEFMENSKGFYNAALYYGWIDEVSKHMTSRFIWTKNLVNDITTKYDNYTEFRKKHKSAYDAAVKYCWLDDVTQHMKKRKVWDDESVKQEALKYQNREAFRLGCLGGYSYAKKNNILDIVTSHMEFKNVKGHKKDVFTCEFCGKKIGGIGNIKRHIKVFHETSKHKS
jgi:predicted GIY-YIG superfamily endonuclease